LNFKTLEDYNVFGKKVLIRVDLNVPILNGLVTDITRLDRVIPTINFVLSHGGIPILLAHRGRPNGVIRKDMSLDIIAPHLEAKLGKKVTFINSNYLKETQKLSPNNVALLENLRFNPGEEKNELSFARNLAELGDLYVNDAFSVSHRAHGSTHALAQLLPNCIGKCLESELTTLESFLSNPTRPLTAVVGGAKISTKIQLLFNLTSKSDNLIIGGGMANTFLQAKGFEIGKSLTQSSMLGVAKEILAKADKSGCRIYLPSDIVVSSELQKNSETEILPATNCPKNSMILDAGPQTITEIQKILKRTKTLIWNGPLGAFEVSPFDNATNKAAQLAAELTMNGEMVSVAGGGDTIAALQNSGALSGFSYVSTAGGAFLEWLEGKPLPGISVIMER
jgi:phosphoglycerate kinase